MDDTRRALLRIEEIAGRGRDAFFADSGEVILVLEVKGHEREQDRAKHAAAEKWVRAVNHHGEFGRWAFVVCKDPNRVREILDELARKAA